jgi:hypothetical protein
MGRRERPQSFNDGEVAFSIVSFEQTESKTSKNPMIKMRFELEDENGVTKTCFDNFVLTENAIWKFYELGDSLGLTAEFESGEIDLDLLVGQIGKAKVVKEANEDKDSPYKHHYRIESFLAAQTT